MTLIEFAEQNNVIAKNQPEYRPMPAYVGDGRVICCWRLSFWERLKVLFIGKIWHHILTGNQPVQPQLLKTESPFIRK
jgi:hypothetical protein